MLRFPNLRVLQVEMEQEKFIETVIPLRGRMKEVARHYLADTQDAEDVVQEAFIKLWCVRGRLDTYVSIEALAVQTTKNLCLNALRNSRLRAGQPLDEDTSMVVADMAPDPHSQMERNEDMARLHAIMNQLPSLQQAVLRMKHLEGLEVSQIALLTGSTPEAVRMNLSRARKTMRDMFIKR